LLSDDTILFMSLDARQFEQGAASLDLAALLREQEVQEFLAPMYERLQGAPREARIDPADPIGTLVDSSPLTRYVASRCAVGFKGIAIQYDDAEGRPAWLRISPSSPVNARALHQFAPSDSRSRPAQPFNELSFDFLAQCEPGPELRALVSEFLANPPPGVEVGKLPMAGREVHSLNVRLDQGRTTLYGDLSGDTWLFGGNAESFKVALNGGPQKTLAGSEVFRRFRERTSRGGEVLFAYADVKKALQVFERFVPPIARDEMEILGFDTFRGIGLGLSMVEGGVRESLLIGFAGRKSGVFEVLDSLGGGFETLVSAPSTTAAFVGVRFDPMLLAQKILNVVQSVHPRNHAAAVDELTNADVAGKRLMADVLPALGSEISVALSPPRTSVWPEAILTVGIRDQAKFDALLSHGWQVAGSEGVTLQDVPLNDGASGFAVRSKEMPIVPSFAVRGDRLYGAISPLGLKTFMKDYVTNPEARPLGQTSEVLPRVMRGLNGGRSESLAALVYLDLKFAIPALYATVAPMLQQPFDESGSGLEVTMLPMPEVLEKHLTGMAAGLSVDDGGISIDVFSPTGITTLGLAAAAIEHWSRQHGGYAEPVEPDDDSGEHGDF